MDNRPIGIFDSGLGGLTAVTALRAVLPDENIIYFGDTGRCPYGTKTREQLKTMTGQNLKFLSSLGCKAIFAACGTVSSNCTELLDSYRIPVFNLLDPSAKAMAEIPGNAPLAVAATEASIYAGSFQKRISELSDGRRDVIGLPCQDFVALCESGNISPDDPLLQRAVERYLAPARENGSAALLLGCTHFGIIAEAIRRYLGDSVKLISAAECGISAMTAFIEENGIRGTGGSSVYYTSGSTEDFDAMAEMILSAGKSHSDLRCSCNVHSIAVSPLSY